MQGSAATGGVDGTGRIARGPLTPAEIDSILADFRAWLVEQSPASASPPVQPMDLFALASQFTALRHEVNMQTRAVRTAVEQNAEAMKLAAAPADSTEQLRPIAKAVVDIADALALSFKQMAKFRDTADELLAEPAAPPGFFARVFGSAPPRDSAKLKQLTAAAADGYALSLRRVERLFADLQLEPIRCEGSAFDPETMEVVEVVGDSNQPSGTVVEAVRPGYRWNGKVLRFAQVKVAR
jgi:molecular chaperone GrpE